VFKCRKIYPTGNRWNRALFTEQKQHNFGCLSNCRYCADRAEKSARASPNNVLTLLQISSKSVHFRRSYSRTRQHRFCPVEYFHDSPKAMLRSGRIMIRSQSCSTAVIISVSRQMSKQRNDATEREGRHR